MTAPREIPERPGAEGELRDGIGEEDNPTPAWFAWSWTATWIVGVLYIAYYVFVSDWSARGQWEAQSALAESQRAAIRAALPTANPYRGDASALEEGAQTFTTICAACHKPDGSGLVGPSLVDAYWKYGSGDAELYASVSEGRPGGMPPWGPQLGSEKIWKALAYLETLPRSEKPGVGSPDYQPPAP